MDNEDDFCTEEGIKAELYNNILLEGMTHKEAGDIVNSDQTKAYIRCNVKLINHWKSRLEEFRKKLEVEKDEH